MSDRSTWHSAAAALGFALVVGGARSAVAAEHPGRAVYLKYCGACHGESGKGDGIVSGFMRPTPTDLTTLAAKNGGKFDIEKVAATIDGRTMVRAHGDPDMPVWGELLGAEAKRKGGDPETAVQTKVSVITEYLATIQAK
jgi:mono/diheme cytochrome c family protein